MGLKDVSNSSGVAESRVIALEEAIVGKAPITHNHSVNDVETLSTLLGQKADTGHTHSIGNVTGLGEALTGKANTADVVTLPSFTAGENITAGEPLFLKDDGKAYKCTAQNILYQAYPFSDSGARVYETCIDYINNRVIAIGHNATGSTLIIAGTISGTSITWGSSVTLYASASTTNLIAVYNANQNVFLLAYNDPTNSNFLTFRALSVSGTTITLGTAVVVSNTISSISLCELTNTSDCAVSYYNSTGATHRFRVVNLSGTTITLRNEFDTTINATRGRVTYDSSTSLLYGAISSGANYGLVEFAISSGTLSVAKGSFTLSTQYSSLFVKAGLDSNLAMFAHKGSIYAVTSNFGSGTTSDPFSIHRFKPISANSTNDVFASSLVFSGSLPDVINTQSNSYYKFFNGKILFMSASDAKIAIFDIENLKLLPILPQLSAITDGFRTMAISDTHIVSFGIAQLRGYTGYQQRRTQVATYWNWYSFVGFATESKNLNQQVKVNIKGSILTTTGLTIGANYFIQENGTIGVNHTPYLIGRAISTTQLLIGS